MSMEQLTYNKYTCVAFLKSFTVCLIQYGRLRLSFQLAFIADHHQSCRLFYLCNNYILQYPTKEKSIKRSNVTVMSLHVYHTFHTWVKEVAQSPFSMIHIPKKLDRLLQSYYTLNQLFFMALVLAYKHKLHVIDSFFQSQSNEHQWHVFNH